jgi:hypothetical protein
MEGQDVVYIMTPRIIINEKYLMQGHHLKYNTVGRLVFFSGYKHEIPLPNPKLHLYKSLELTFTLVPQEEVRRSSMYVRLTSVTLNFKDKIECINLICVPD